MTGSTAAVISVEHASSFCLSVSGYVVAAIVGRFTSGVDNVRCRRLIRRPRTTPQPFISTLVLYQ